MHQLSAELVQIHQQRLRHEAEHLGLVREHGTVSVWRRTVGHGLVELGSRIGRRGRGV